MEKSIISHFSDPNAKGRDQWLLFSAKAIEQVDLRICRIWQALGVSDVAAVLAAIKCWTEKKRMPEYGLVIRGTNLKVFRSSRGEGYGMNARYIAFGSDRPKKSVDDTYLCGAVEMGAQLPGHSGRRRQRSELGGSEGSGEPHALYGPGDELEWKTPRKRNARRFPRDAAVDLTSGSSGMRAGDTATGLATSAAR
jgi:hypothetical protein